MGIFTPTKSEMASLSNSRWQNRKERHNNGDIVDKAKRLWASVLQLSNYRKAKLPKMILNYLTSIKTMLLAGIVTKSLNRSASANNVEPTGWGRDGGELGRLKTVDYTGI